MRSTAFVLITLVVGSLANPNVLSVFGKDRAQVATNERIVTGQIIEAIEAVAQAIRDAGLDPYNLDTAVSYELPVPVLLSVDAIVDQLYFSGLSNIVIRNINFSLLQSRLTFDIELPGVNLSIGNAKVSGIVFGDNYEASIDGSFNINSIRITGDIRVNIGIISGISIRSLAMTLNLGGIQSNLNINLLGTDISSRVNTFFGTSLPDKLNEFEKEINKLIEILAIDLIEDFLNNSI